jgi:ankyrin repeat protein
MKGFTFKIKLDLEHSESVKTLIQLGADVDQDCGNNTPLTYACEMGNIDMIKMLLDLGANPNVKSNYGSSIYPLEIIAKASDVVEEYNAAKMII